jgi:thiamine biosynthesis protein ThiS
MIAITLNGKSRQIEGLQSVITLLDSLNIKGLQVAVAINGSVVSRDAWQQTVVAEGDTLEIVRAVGGG